MTPAGLARAGCAAALACAASLPAAACSFLETGGELPAVSSFVVRNGPAQAAAASLQFNCTGVVLALLTGTPALSAALVTPASGLTLKNGGFSIPYSVGGTGGVAYANGQVVISVNGAAVVGLLTGAGARVPVNILTSVGPNVPAGTYTDTLSVAWTYQNICEGLASVAGLCLGQVSNGSAVLRSLAISLTVTNDCAITAPPVQFGAAPLLSAFPAVSQNIALLCTRGLAYTVGLSPGGNPAAGGRRQMAAGANQRLQYDVFKPDGTVWGASGAARANGPAPADGVNTQLLPYTARIYGDQPAPAAGGYSDSITVDIGF